MQNISYAPTRRKKDDDEEEEKSTDVYTQYESPTYTSVCVVERNKNLMMKFLYGARTRCTI